MKLWQKKPDRLFTFGCSFTMFHWTTWANIMGHELKPIEFYNYGKIGAGNSYISAMIVQADAIHKFTPDDLVMVCWSGIQRHDFFDEDNTTWHTPGSLANVGRSWATPDIFNTKEWLAMTNTSNFLFRDYTTIKTTIGYLKKTNAHHMQMTDIMTRYSSDWRDPATEVDVQTSVRDIYKDIFEELHPCYFNTLWDGSLKNKAKRNKQFSPKFNDFHPTPGEHLEYLQKTFDHHWSDETIQAVRECDDDLRKDKPTIICEPRESCLVYS